MPSPPAARTPWFAVSALAGVLGLRMLGLFLLLPVLALHARAFADATPFLAGLAVGIYGATQAVFQIPFGALSDRIGRRAVIVFGLLVFVAGSVLAATAGSVWVVIAGRALQGAGAISSAATAFAADLAPPGARTRAMALLGIAVGASFTVAIVLGPPLAGLLGVPGLMLLVAGLALGAAALVVAVLPDDRASSSSRGALPRSDLAIVPRTLYPVMFGVFVVHALITAVFVAVPGILRDVAGLPVASHWRVYLPALLAGTVLLTLPLIWWAERSASPGPRRTAFALIAVGLAALAAGAGDAPRIALALGVFFGGFNLLEANLPALIAENVAAETRGRAMGVYATLQFVGAFVGGALGGALNGLGGPRMSLAAGVGLALVGLLAVARTPRPATPA